MCNVNIIVQSVERLLSWSHTVSGGLIFPNKCMLAGTWKRMVSTNKTASSGFENPEEMSPEIQNNPLKFILKGLPMS